MKIPKITGVTWGEVHIKPIPDEAGQYEVFLHDFKFHVGELETVGMTVDDAVEQVLRKSAIFLIDNATSDRSDW